VLLNPHIDTKEAQYSTCAQCGEVDPYENDEDTIREAIKDELEAIQIPADLEARTCDYNVCIVQTHVVVDLKCRTEGWDDKTETLLPMCTKRIKHLFEVQADYCEMDDWDNISWEDILTLPSNFVAVSKKA
jgi:hypothetical protein